jgi:hypothetical protein
VGLENVERGDRSTCNSLGDWKFGGKADQDYYLASMKHGQIPLQVIPACLSWAL